MTREHYGSLGVHELTRVCLDFVGVEGGRGEKK